MLDSSQKPMSPAKMTQLLGSNQYETPILGSPLNSFSNGSAQDSQMLTLQKFKRRKTSHCPPGGLQPLKSPTSLETPKDVELLQMKLLNKNELLFMDEMTAEDKFYLIQQIEDQVSPSSRYG
jgi:hypothetical protein